MVLAWLSPNYSSDIDGKTSPIFIQEFAELQKIFGVVMLGYWIYFVFVRLVHNSQMSIKSSIDAANPINISQATTFS